MTGKFNGLVTRIKQITHKDILSTKFFIHKEQLVAKDMDENSSSARISNTQCTNSVLNNFNAKCIIILKILKHFVRVLQNNLHNSQKIVIRRHSK